MLLMHQCVWSYRWLPTALAFLLLVSSAVTSAHSTTVEHDFHVVHNVDNRSPEIDPFWYVGRGVRPIGRFGKRHSGYASPGSRAPDPVFSSLRLLLTALRNEENSGKSGVEQGSRWLP